MKNLLFLFITILFFSCQEKKIDLTGHWHITKHNGSDRSFGLYKTLDFENDSIVYLGRYLNGNGGIMGFVNHQKKTMEFDPLQSGEFFTFSTKSENKILLRTDNKFYKADYLLERISSTCCDKQVHFFQDVPAIIDLPIISPNGIYESRKHLSLEFPVHIGEPKKEFRKELGKEHQIILKYKSSNVGMSMIDALEKNFKIKIPENKRPETKRLIYADKNTPVALIEEITNYYRLKNITKVYLVLRTDGICNKIETHLKNIHDFDPSNSKTIDEWLHKESKS